MEKEIKPQTDKMRACLNCSIILPLHVFKYDGCPNCPFLSVNKNYNQITSSSFKGIIYLFNPKKSWAAKWQRINDYIPGTYAMTVSGDLNDYFIEKVEKNGRVYVNRTNSFSIE